MGTSSTACRRLAMVLSVALIAAAALGSVCGCAKATAFVRLFGAEVGISDPETVKELTTTLQQCQDAGRTVTLANPESAFCVAVGPAGKTRSYWLTQDGLATQDGRVLGDLTQAKAVFRLILNYVCASGRFGALLARSPGWRVTLLGQDLDPGQDPTATEPLMRALGALVPAEGVTFFKGDEAPLLVSSIAVTAAGEPLLVFDCYLGQPVVLRYGGYTAGFLTDSDLLVEAVLGLAALSFTAEISMGDQTAAVSDRTELRKLIAALTPFLGPCERGRRVGEDEDLYAPLTLSVKAQGKTLVTCEVGSVGVAMKGVFLIPRVYSVPSFPDIVFSTFLTSARVAESVERTPRPLLLARDMDLSMELTRERLAELGNLLAACKSESFEQSGLPVCYFPEAPWYTVEFELGGRPASLVMLGPGYRLDWNGWGVLALTDDGSLGAWCARTCPVERPPASEVRFLFWAGADVSLSGGELGEEYSRPYRDRAVRSLKEGKPDPTFILPEKPLRVLFTFADGTQSEVLVGENGFSYQGATYGCPGILSMLLGMLNTP